MWSCVANIYVLSTHMWQVLCYGLYIHAIIGFSWDRMLVTLSHLTKEETEAQRGDVVGGC